MSIAESCFQVYGSVVSCTCMLVLLNPRWEIKTHLWRYLGIFMLWFVCNGFELAVFLRLTQSSSIWFLMFMVISRFLLHYLFLSYVRFLSTDNFLKVFFNFFFTGFFLEVFHLVAQLTLPVIRNTIGLESSESVEVAYVIVIITCLYLICMPVILKFIRFYRRLEIKVTIPSCILTSAAWMIVGSGVLPNRITDEYYGGKMALYVVFLFGGVFLFLALVFWNDYEKEIRQNRYMKMKRKLLEEHGKALEKQMTFSKDLQKEIEKQLTYHVEGRRPDREEVGEYYSRILEIVKNSCNESYFHNPVLDELMERQFKIWKSQGKKVKILRRNLYVQKKDTLKWMEIFHEIFAVAEMEKIKSGKVIELSMDKAIGRDMVSLSFEREKGKVTRKEKRLRKSVEKRIENLIRVNHGQVMFEEKDTRMEMLMILDQCE